MSELKPCPFCGSPIANNGCFKSDIGAAYWVRCPLCKAEGPTAIYGTDQAGELWNTRASDEVIRGLVEALKEIINENEGWIGDHSDKMTRIAEKVLAQARKHLGEA